MAQAPFGKRRSAPSWRAPGLGRQWPRDLARRLVLAQALIHDLAQKPLVGPGQERDFGDKLGADPMDTRQDQRRTETAGAGRRNIKRHALAAQRLQPPPQPQQLGRIHARSCARGVDELAVRRVVGQQQPREMRAGVMLPYTVGGMERWR